MGKIEFMSQVLLNRETLMLTASPETCNMRMGGGGGKRATGGHGEVECGAKI